MCGIIGIFNKLEIKNRKNKKYFVNQIIQGLNILKNRGRDNFGVFHNNKLFYNHDLQLLKDSIYDSLKDASLHDECLRDEGLGDDKLRDDKLRDNDLHDKGLRDSNLNMQFYVGHCLHSVVGNVPQPIINIQNKSGLAANCEIYNWKELNKKYNLTSKNDAKLILQLIDLKGVKKIKEILNELDGDYTFTYWNDTEIILARDNIGIKPIFYSYSGQSGFAFASEKKTLLKLDYTEIIELNPRKILIYNKLKNTIKIIERKFFKINESKLSKDKIKKETTEKLIESIKKRLPNKKLGILFSGGVDSSTLALICKKLGVDFTCYTAVLSEDNMSEAEDLIYAKKVAADLGLNLKIKKINLTQIPNYLRKIIPIIEDTNVTKVGVALTFYLACELAKKDGVKVILSGLGSEEIFAGYDRHKKAAGIGTASIDDFNIPGSNGTNSFAADSNRISKTINSECISGLLKMYERDLYRDDTISMANSLELRVPFLDKELISFAMKIPGRLKVENGIEKSILREIAEDLGLKKEFAWRKKKAAQYGSKLHQGIEKLTKRNGFKLKSEYLKTFYPSNNLKLGALISGGKDSLYAMHIMIKQNYEIGCLITIKSKNQDSYMFHTPGIDMVDLQAKALNLPLLTQYTEGIKEKELDDLKTALIFAKQKYKIDGIITGALFSSYQRDRIEKICDQLSLKIFSPLWHINQETEMRSIISEGFQIILTSIAADGLNKSWLRKKITNAEIDNLVKLNKKIGLNIAGEGGEFESLVLDMPGFTKKIKILKSKIHMENECTGRLIIEKAELIKK